MRLSFLENIKIIAVCLKGICLGKQNSYVFQNTSTNGCHFFKLKTLIKHTYLTNWSDEDVVCCVLGILDGLVSLSCLIS